MRFGIDPQRFYKILKQCFQTCKTHFFGGCLLVNRAGKKSKQLGVTIPDVRLFAKSQCFLAHSCLFQDTSKTYLNAPKHTISRENPTILDAEKPMSLANGRLLGPALHRLHILRWRGSHGSRPWLDEFQINEENQRNIDTMGIMENHYFLWVIQL